MQLVWGVRESAGSSAPPRGLTECESLGQRTQGSRSRAGGLRITLSHLPKQLSSPEVRHTHLWSLPTPTKGARHGQIPPPPLPRGQGWFKVRASKGQSWGSDSRYSKGCNGGEGDFQELLEGGIRVSLAWAYTDAHKGFLEARQGAVKNNLMGSRLAFTSCH